MAGEYIEQRIIGMLMAQPRWMADYPDLDRLMVDEGHRRIWRTIRDLKSSDLVELGLHLTPELLDYVYDLALCESFSTDNFPAYVRALNEIDRERSFGVYCARRLRPHNIRGANPFRAI